MSDDIHKTLRKSKIRALLLDDGVTCCKRPLIEVVSANTEVVEERYLSKYSYSSKLPGRTTLSMRCQRCGAHLEGVVHDRDFARSFHDNEADEYIDAQVHVRANSVRHKELHYDKWK